MDIFCYDGVGLWVLCLGGDGPALLRSRARALLRSRAPALVRSCAHALTRARRRVAGIFPAWGRFRVAELLEFSAPTCVVPRPGSIILVSPQVGAALASERTPPMTSPDSLSWIESHAADYLAEARRGGASRATATGAVPSRGYMVGGAAPCSRVPLTHATPSDVVRFARREAATLARPDVYLGAWVSEGILVLDASECIPTLGAALTLAARRREEEVYDVERDRCIPVLGVGVPESIV